MMDEEVDLFAPIQRHEIGEIVAGFGFVFMWMPAVGAVLLEWYVIAVVLGLLWALAFPLGVWLDQHLTET